MAPPPGMSRSASVSYFPTAGMDNLDHLTLNDNRLTTLGKGFFRGLSSLTTLYIDHNEINTIDNDAFEGLEGTYSISALGPGKAIGVNLNPGPRSVPTRDQKLDPTLIIDTTTTVNNHISKWDCPQLPLALWLIRYDSSVIQDFCSFRRYTRWPAGIIYQVLYSSRKSSTICMSREDDILRTQK